MAASGSQPRDRALRRSPTGAATHAPACPQHGQVQATGRAPAKLRALVVRAQFLHVARGKHVARPGVVVQARPSLSASRGRPDVAGTIGVGFTATRKIGGAVVRNRAKRRLRAAATAMLPVHGVADLDYVFVARAGTPERAWTALLDDVKTALVRLREAHERVTSPDSPASAED